MPLHWGYWQLLYHLMLRLSLQVQTHVLEILQWRFDESYSNVSSFVSWCWNVYHKRDNSRLRFQSHEPLGCAPVINERDLRYDFILSVYVVWYLFYLNYVWYTLRWPFVLNTFWQCVHENDFVLKRFWFPVSYETKDRIIRIAGVDKHIKQII